MTAMMVWQLVLALFVTIFVFNCECSLDAKLNHPKFQCEIVCSRAGGKNDYNETTKSCKCLLDNKVDATDLALLQKYAKIIGLNVTSIESLNPSIIVIKREAKDENHNEVESTTIQIDSATDKINSEIPTTVALALPTTTEEVPVNPEGIVGQKFSLKRLQHRLGQRRSEPKPITQEQHKRILQQMRDHINRLGIINDQRARQLEIDALRSNLKQLSESVIIQVPTQRSRLRVVAEEARKRTLRPRLTPHSRLVGASAPQIETSTLKDLSAQKNEAESAVKEIKRIHPHFEIITQNPNLIDD